MMPETAQRILTAAAVFAALIAAPAEAQPRPRNGPFLGASIGLGNSSPGLCTGCNTGLYVGARGGARLRPHLALLAEGLFISVAPNILSDVRGRHNALLAGLQYWPAERFWLKGAIGVAGVQRAAPPAYDYTTNHIAGLAGIGFEFNPRSRVVVEIALSEMMSGDSPARFTGEAPHETAVHSVMLTLGVTWHRR